MGTCCAAWRRGILLGGLAAGAGVSRSPRAGGLALFFAVFIGYSALQMFLDKKPGLPADAGRGWQTAVGGTIGLMSGLVAPVAPSPSVPFMTWCNVPLRRAVGTSAALGFSDRARQHAGLRGERLAPTALPGAFGFPCTCRRWPSSPPPA